jgi:hypothetical protein
MTYPIEFGLATSNSYPTGTGSYGYNGEIYLVVQDIAFDKEVSVWARSGSNWASIPAKYIEDLPENRELWVAKANNSEDEFVARYSVNGLIYWDNNNGHNYDFPKAYGTFLAVTGNQFKVVMGSAHIANSKIEVDLGIQNLAFDKVVGILFTIDHWSTTQVTYANWSRTMNSGLEVWHASANIYSASEVEFAAFYQVNGEKYWGNNFWRNYQITPTTPQKWGMSN